MKKISVGILAHVDSGKTTLSEAFMYASGAISKPGRVDHGNSFLDTFELERSRGITIFSKQAVFKYNNTQFTLLDTPGHIDFSAEAERTLQVLDYAVLVISGTSGVQGHTYTLWRLLSRYNIPVFVYVNKMDLDGADKAAVLSQLKEKLSDSIVDFSSDIPVNQLYENIALCDDKLLEGYYENETLKTEDIANAVRERKLFPCFFGSALKLAGVKELLQGLDRYTVMPSYGSEFGAKVYKIAEDSQKNRLTFLKITGGSLAVREVLKSKNNTEGEKVNQIRIYSGERFTTADRVAAGTICAVTGISFAHTGDGLGTEPNSDLPMLEPVLTYTVQLLDGTDAHTAMRYFKILQEEDPQLNVVWNEEAEEIQLQLMGDIQLEILKSILSERFNLQVGFGTGSIIYKETIKNTVEGVGHFEPLRHYAEVHLLLRPGKRGSGLTFTSECREDVLDKNWQRLILTHLQEKAHIGVLTGSPITDIEIVLASGKAHPKHTEGGDFRQATYRAVRQGLRSAESLLLEPVYNFTLEVPSENAGRAMSDIQRMYGSFAPPENGSEAVVLTGTAPAVTMANYSKEVAQYTHGRGSLVCVLKGYEPCHNAEEVIESIGYNCDTDGDNPCDSVFCSHGAGHTVKWYDVPKYMHLPSALQPEEKAAAQPTGAGDRVFARFETQSGDIFAQDKELMAIFEKTYGPIKKKNYNEEEASAKRVVSFDNKAKAKRAKQQYEGKSYLLVDGYNVIFSWKNLKELAKDSLDTARNTLINIMCNYQGYKKCELILVFDAYRVKGQHREVEKINNINVIYTKEAETADMYIERATHTLAKNNRVRVVTSDGMEQLIILGNGALRVSSQAFLTEVELAQKEIREIIESQNK